jgi:hypothetical protein
MSRLRLARNATAARGGKYVLIYAAAAAGLLVIADFALAASTVFGNRVAFESTLANIVLDDYEDPRYQVGDLADVTYFDVHSNGSMNGIFGETSYTPTGWINTNVIGELNGNHYYCAGCNGSYLLDFTGTSVGTTSGVFGAGLDVVGAENPHGTHAFVTYGDGSTEDFIVPQVDAFWGITSNLLIKTIHFGLANGGTNTDLDVQVMAMDNLTIGAAVPEPTTVTLVGVFAAAAIATVRRRLVTFLPAAARRHPPPRRYPVLCHASNSQILRTRGAEELMRSRFAVAVATMVVIAGGAHADDITYFRFEEGAADAEFQPPISPGGPGSGIAVDSAGGDDIMRTWADYSTPVFRSDVPAAIIPRTGAPNTLSLQFAFPEDLYSEGAPINYRQFNQFTIEASVKFNNLNGWQTFFGKDGFSIPGSPDPNLSSLYFQLSDSPDANQNKVAIKVHDANGNFVELFTQQTAVTDHWYNFAAIMDGTSLSLYREENGSYLLEDSKPFTGPMALQDRTWTIGRGMFGNNPTDWINGFVDEVRISDTALATSDLLFAAPEPATSALLLIAVATWLFGRGRSA